MPYRAGPGPGLFGSYTFPDSRPKIDVGGILDAAANGASSLIHGAYMKRLADANMQIAQREQADRDQQVAIEQAREAREGQTADREFGLKAEAERHRFIEAGGIPESTQFNYTTPNTDDVTSGYQANVPKGVQPYNPAGAGPGLGTDQSPIARAMSAAPGVPQSVAPTPPAAPPRATTTPESFDPMRNVTTARQLAVQDLRNQGWDTRENIRAETAAARDAQKAAQQRSNLEFSKKADADRDETVARIRAGASGAKGGGGARAMTAGQREQMVEKHALGLLDSNGGSYDSAIAYLNSPEGKSLRDEGMTPNHLAYAHSQYEKGQRPTISQVTGLLNSGAAPDVPSAARTVQQADSAVKVMRSPRQIVGPTSATPSPTAKQSPAVQQATSPIAVPGADPRTGRSLARPAKPTSTGPVAGSATKPPAAPTPAPATPYTDEEVSAAMKAGAKTEQAVHDYITKRRAAKPPAGSSPDNEDEE